MNGFVRASKDLDMDDVRIRKNLQDNGDSRKNSREIRNHSKSRSRSRDKEKFEDEEGQVSAPINKHKKDKKDRDRREKKDKKDKKSKRDKDRKKGY